MTFDPQKHHRRSIRLKGYDYSQAGAYFVTIVAYQREALFGEIVHGMVCLNEWGALVENEWRRLEKRFDRVSMDEFIVMPNHLHGVLVIKESIESIGQLRSGLVGAGHENSILSGDSSLAPPLQSARSLGAIIQAYKSTTARWINSLRRTTGAPVWQRYYYEHIVRDAPEMNRNRQYIQENPQHWEKDRENPFKTI
jgi:REP element-mobilizing transposase RayT